MELGIVHHVAINVADYEQSKNFYVNLLGFAVLGEYLYPSGTRRLDCQKGNARLEIFWNGNVSTRAEFPHIGYRHLCFYTADIEKTVAELNDRGISTEAIRTDPMAGGRLTFFYDPDGLQLEVHE